MKRARELRLYPFLLIALLSITAPSCNADNAFTLDELLNIPHVSSEQSDGQGRIAWVEQRNGTWNVYVATAPDYAARQLTNYKQDDGQIVTLVGFVPGAQRLVFQRGMAQLNPAHLPTPP